MQNEAFIQLVREWYLSEYPEDNLGKDISADITFKTLWQRMGNGEEFYSVIGVEDSVIRCRVVLHMATVINLPYDIIHTLWMNGELDPYRKNDLVRAFYTKGMLTYTEMETLIA